MAIEIVIGIVLFVLTIAFFTGIYICSKRKFAGGKITCTIAGILCCISILIVPFSIARTGNVVNADSSDDNIEIKEYLTLDGTCAWLVLNKVQKLDGKVYELNGNNMLWSEKYQAYCYVVISPAAPEITLEIKGGNTVSVDYSGDIDLDGHVDTTDILIVQNIYNANFNVFTEEITPELFLRADLNGSGDIAIDDAVVLTAITTT